MNGDSNTYCNDIIKTRLSTDPTYPLQLSNFVLPPPLLRWRNAIRVIPVVSSISAGSLDWAGTRTGLKFRSIMNMDTRVHQWIGPIIRRLLVTVDGLQSSLYAQNCWIATVADRSDCELPSSITRHEGSSARRPGAVRGADAFQEKPRRENKIGYIWCIRKLLYPAEGVTSVTRHESQQERGPRTPILFRPCGTRFPECLSSFTSSVQGRYGEEWGSF